MGVTITTDEFTYLISAVSVDAVSVDFAVAQAPAPVEPSPSLHCPGGAIVKAFTCGACGKMSQVKDVKHDAGQTFLVCEHCSAEHTMRKVFGSPGVLPEVRAGPLRGAPRDESDAE